MLALPEKRGPAADGHPGEADQNTEPAPYQTHSETTTIAKKKTRAYFNGSTTSPPIPR